MERIRDELFRILDGKKIHSTIHALDILGVLDIILPELMALKKIEISTTPEQSGWNFTLSMLRNLELIFSIFTGKDGHPDAENLIYAIMISHLGKYRSRINDHYSKTLAGERALHTIIMLAAIYLEFGQIPGRVDGKLDIPHN